MFQIYDTNFQRIGVLKNWNYSEWERRYNEFGSATFKMRYNSKVFNLLRMNNILYHSTINEATIIKNILLTVDSDNNERIDIYAVAPSFILTQRVVSYTGSGSLTAIIHAMINQTIVSPTDAARRIPNFTILPNNLGAINAGDVQFENVILYDAVKNLCQTNGVGFRVFYNRKNKSYDFQLYKGIEAKAVFSRKHANTVSQDYFRYSADHKNVALVGTTFIGNATGINRYEAYTSQNSQGGAINQQGKLFLQNYKERVAFDTVLNANSKQFPYLKSWNLGDTVTLKESAWEVLDRKIVSEVTECVDADGFHLAAVFGDLALTLNERMGR